MIYKDKINFNKDVEAIYKSIMPPLYRKWMQYTDQEIREMFYLWVVHHQHEKYLDLINRKKHRKLKVKKIAMELEKIRNRLAFENDLQEAVNENEKQTITETH
jgi:hypothetical protein